MYNVLKEKLKQQINKLPLGLLKKNIIKKLPLVFFSGPAPEATVNLQAKGKSNKFPKVKIKRSEGGG